MGDFMLLVFIVFLIINAVRIKDYHDDIKKMKSWVAGRMDQIEEKLDEFGTSLTDEQQTIIYTYRRIKELRRQVRDLNINKFEFESYEPVIEIKNKINKEIERQELLFKKSREELNSRGQSN